MPADLSPLTKHICYLKLIKSLLSQPQNQLLRMRDQLSLLIKTFLRPQSCVRLVSSIRSIYPTIPILVADDGDAPSALADALAPYAVQMIHLPFDSGISKGRNALLDAAQTPLVALLDDDFLFTPATRLEGAVALLHQNPDLDLVAGGFEDGYELHGQLQLDADILRVCKEVASGASSQGLPLYDFVLNFFVARREALRKVRWDEDLKTCEHLEFFVRAKRQGLLRSTYAPHVFQVQHVRADASEQYAAYRFGRVKHFGALAWKKMGICERLMIAKSGDIEQHSIFREDGEQASDRTLHQYIRLFTAPPVEPLDEVVRRDMAWLGRFADAAPIEQWPQHSSPNPKHFSDIHALFNQNLLCREILRVTHVCEIPQRPSPSAAEIAPAEQPSFADKDRAEALLQFARMCARVPGSAVNESEVWAWIGVAPRVAHHVWQQGSAQSLCSAGGLTQGTLGNGYYLTPQAHYAALYATGRLGYRRIQPSAQGYALLLCRVCLGRIYPVTRRADYTGRSQHPGSGPRCDHWGQPLKADFDSHIGIVSEQSFWQVTENPRPEDIAEIALANPDRINPVAVVFFQFAPQYQRDERG